MRSATDAANGWLDRSRCHMTEVASMSAKRCFYLAKTFLASFSAVDPLTHCQGVRGLRAFASSGFAFASLTAARSRSRASRESILSS